MEMRGRRFVLIQDPHLKKDPGYFVYQSILKIEAENLEADRQAGKLNAASGKYLVRDPTSHLEIFTGQCWPGDSVWLDFFQHKVRQFWTSLYDYKIHDNVNKNFYAWNDMNEPSVLNKAELTFPKGAM